MGDLGYPHFTAIWAAVPILQSLRIQWLAQTTKNEYIARLGVLVPPLVVEINTQQKQLRGASIYFGTWLDDKKVAGALSDWSHSRQSQEVECQMLVLCSLAFIVWVPR